MSTNSIKFEINGKDVTVDGYPELEGCRGILTGDGMAFFFENGLYVANTVSGKIRRFSIAGGPLLVEDNEIDYDAIEKYCQHGIYNARTKGIRYAGLNRWDGFKNGLCALTWMLYPDGMYFADSDGFGGKDNDEENVYAIIDTNLDIVEPFRPIDDVSAYLKKIRGIDTEL